MTDYTQDNRLYKVQVAGMGPDDFLVESFSGHEKMSEPYVYDLRLYSQTYTWDPTNILGKELTLTIATGGEQRFLSGIIRRFVQEGAEEPFAVYTAEIVPWTWRMSLRKNSRIFQEQTAKDIVEAVLTEHSTDFRFSLRGSPPQRTYCVQYGETDLDFVQRLLEEEGIFYFFEHQDGRHTMVLSDDSPQAPSCTPQSTVRLATQAGEWQEEDIVLQARLGAQLHSGTVVVRDFNFEQPDDMMEVSSPTVSQLPDLGAFEVFEYPGLYQVSADGTTRADARMAEVEALENTLVGTSSCPSFQTGCRFTLEEHFVPTANGDWVLTDVQHRGHNAWQGTGGAAYENVFVAIPSATPYRPPRRTRRPVIGGLQTATVVGPSSEEIYTDEFGRIKVQFHWDRVGENNETSSCWIRVSTPWAGPEWGSIHIPRIGWEVVVSFEEGDPDRPLVIGSLWNGLQKPPYKLPDNQTQSGIKSRSSTEGGVETFNELRFEDKKDEEHIHLHAEKDFVIEVENTETRTVDRDRVTVIKGEAGKGSGDPDPTDSLAVKKGNQTITLDQGDRTLTLKNGNQTVTLENGDQTVTLSNGNQTITLDNGDRTIELTTGNQTTKLAAGKTTHEAMQSILFKVGAASIKLEPAKITIKAPQIAIQADATLDAKAAMTNVSGDGMLILKGGLTKIN